MNADLKIIDVEIPDFITQHINDVLRGVDIQMLYNVEDSFKNSNLYIQLTEWIVNVIGEDLSIVEDKILTRKGLNMASGEWHTDKSYFENIEFYKCALLWVDGPPDTGNVMFLDDDGNIAEIPFRKNKLLIFNPELYHKSCSYNSNDVRIAVLLNLTKNG